MSRARVTGSRRGLRRVVASWIGSVLIALSGVAPASAVGDFQLLVTPADQLLPPGGSVAFLVQVGSVGGFADEVTLTVGDLPDGVTFQLSDDTVTPPASVHLTLIASEEAEVGSFPIVVTGTGGGITHQATGSVTVDFGLIPICYARVEGTVTDRETDQPIAGAEILTFPDVVTDAQGHYSYDQVGLGENNAPSSFSLIARKTGYWQAFSDPADFVCGQLTRVDITLLRQVGAAAHGTVVEGTVDPTDPDVVIPGSAPIQGIHVGFEVSLIPGSGPDITGADGAFQVSLDHLGTDNTPMSLSLFSNENVNFTDEVFWPRGGSTPSPILLGEVAPGDDVAVPPIGMVRKCFGSISGTLVYGDTLQPAVGVTVQVGHHWYFAQDVTDATGAFEIPTISLAYNNQPTDVNLSASVSTGFYGFAQGETHLDACGDQKVVALVLPPVLFGAVEGRVIDVETDLPLEGALVGLVFSGCVTCEPHPAIADPDGDYRINKIPALLSPETAGYSIEASHTGYWWERDGFEISAGDVATRDFALLRMKFASLSGTVTDAITGLPIEGATGGATHKIGAATTGGQGTYSQSNIEIGYRNVPLEGTVGFVADGYWPSQVSATFEADKETIADLEMIPICEGATIRGRVVDATNQQPLEDATVVVVGNGSDLTLADGTYEISGIQVGTNNSPISVSVFASKEGYFTQSKTITVFCGASISINFGPEPPLGALEGFVTNAVTGDPIANVLIVGEFGEETRTDADGHYLFEEVPVNDDGSPKTWNVTALPSGFTLQTKPVTVRANETARLDFQFGDAPPLGSFSLTKRADGPPGEWAFDVTGGPFDSCVGQEDFVLAKDETVTCDAELGRVVTITEPDPGDRYVLSIDCQDAPNADIDLANRRVSITLVEQPTQCTFTNTFQVGSFILTKRADGPPGEWAFDVTGGPFDSCVGQEDFVLAKDETVTCNAEPGRVVTITEPSPGDDHLLTAIDCHDAPNVAIDLAARSVAITLLAGQVTSCDFINTFQEPADAAVFLIIDEDSLDNGLQFNASGGPIVPGGPDRFSARDVNDDRAGPRQRDVLTYFAANVGRSITVKTGQTGDEGWFAPNCIPQKWISGASNACLDAGAARDTAVGRYIGIPDATAVPVQSRLDKIPAVMPLRARGLASLVGQTVCAVVYDSDISINYDRSTFPYTSANLQGATLGIVAFEVTAVRRLTGFSGSTLPEVQLTITETSACGNLVLFNAPVPKSSAVPNDIDPGKLSFDYRNPPSFRTRVNEELFY